MSEEEFWSSSKGLRLRLGYLAEQITLGTYNRAIQVESSVIGINYFVIVGGLILTSCEWCEEHLNRVYRRGQFMPRLPHHPNCIHSWDVVISKGVPFR